MMKFMRKSKGFISIFLCLVLLPMVTFSTMVIDVSRIQNARALVTSAGDLAMNAGMSEYNKTLQEMYGIFATNTSSEDLEKALANYFAKTIEGSIGTNNMTEKDYIQNFSNKFMEEIFHSEDIQNGDFTNFMQMVLDAQTEASKNFEYGCVDNSSPANPAVMKQQIVDYMKYKGPISLSMNLLDKIGAMKDAKKQSEVVEKKLDYTKTLDDITDPCEKAFKAVYGENVEFDEDVKGYNDYVKTYNDNYLSNDKAFNKGLISESAAYQNIVDNMEKMTEFALYYTIAMIASGQLAKPQGAAGYNMADAGLEGLKYDDFLEVIHAKKDGKYDGWANGSQSTIDGCCKLFDKYFANMNGDDNSFSFFANPPLNNNIITETREREFDATEFEQLIGNFTCKIKTEKEGLKEIAAFPLSEEEKNKTYIKKTDIESFTLDNNDPKISKDLIADWQDIIKAPEGDANSVDSYSVVSEADGKTFDLILNTLDGDGKRYEDILKFIYYYEQINTLNTDFNDNWEDYKDEIKDKVNTKKELLKIKNPKRYDYENSIEAQEQRVTIDGLENRLKEYDEVILPAERSDLSAKETEYNRINGIYQNYRALLSDIDDDNRDEDDENEKENNIYSRIIDIIEEDDYNETFRTELSDIVNSSSYNTADKIYQALNDKKTAWETAKTSAESAKNAAQTKLNIDRGVRSGIDSELSIEKKSYNDRKGWSKQALDHDADLLVKNEEGYYDKQLKKDVVNKLKSELDGINLKGFLEELSERVKQFKEHGKPYLKKAMEEIDDFYVCVCNCYNFANASEEALNEVLQHYDKVEAALKDWQNSVNAVEDNTTKATMASDANSTSTGLKKDDIEHAKTAAQNRKKYFSELKEMLECIRFFEDGKLVDSSKADSFKVTESYVDTIYNRILDHKDKNGLGNVAQGKRNTEKIRDSKSKELVVGASGHSGHLLDSRPNSKKPTAFEWSPEISLVKENDYEIKLGDMMDGYKTNPLSGTSEGESYDYEIFFKILINIVKPKENNDETAKKNADKIKQVKDDAVKDKGNMPEASSKSKGSGSGSDAGKVEKQTTTAAATTVYKDEILTNALKSISDYGENKGTCADNTNDAGDKRKDFELSDKKKDYSKKSEQAKESMKQAGNLLDNLSRLGKNVLQDAYLEEYFTEMFTCQTDILYKNVEVKNAKMLNGFTIKEMYRNDTAWYGGEIEYIVWGGNDVVSAKLKNEVAIYALRLVFNVIYAFTAADIHEFTLAAATAIAGWTVVGVPLVQFMLTLGLAAAESALDVIKLKNGEDVAIYKNQSTFVCSPSGALQYAATTVAEYAISSAAELAQDKLNKTVDSIVDGSKKKISELTSEQKDKLKTSFVDSQAENLKSTVKNMIATPLIDKLKPVFILKDTSKERFNADINSAFDEAFASITSSISSIDNEIVKSFATTVAAKLETYYETELNKADNSILGWTAENYAKMINDKVDDIVDSVKGIIDGKLDEIEKDFENKLDEYGDKSVNKLREITTKCTTSAAEKLTSNATKLIDDKLGDIDVKKVDSSSSGSVTLNYKEYCKIFVLIGLISEDNQAAMLQRCAALCQANVQHPGEPKFKADDSFEMVKVNTVVTVHAKVKLGTLFPWGVTVSENGTMNDTSVNISQLGGHSVIIDYQGVNAY